MRIGHSGEVRSCDDRQIPILLDEVIFKTNVLMVSSTDDHSTSTIAYVTDSIDKGVIRNKNIDHPTTLVASPPPKVALSIFD